MGIRAPDICDADELVARAAAMRDTLRARQAECEAQGRLPDPTNREYVEAGFFRVLQPRRFGGLELGLQPFLRVAIELSRGCPSSGWVYALTAGHAHTKADEHSCALVHQVSNRGHRGSKKRWPGEAAFQVPVVPDAPVVPVVRDRAPTS